MKPELEGKRPIRIHLLNGESLLLNFDSKAHVSEVFQRVCNVISIREHQFFGLSIVKDREVRFLDVNHRINKYAPKEWSKPVAKKGSRGASLQLAPAFELKFQVQFFVEHPRLIRDEKSRRHYYLHMKRNVLESVEPISDELVLTLAATSLHIQCGDFDERLHVGSYFNPHEHVPKWFIKKWQESYIIANLPSMHRELIDLSEYDAHADYIKDALCVDDVPVHTYKLFKTKDEAQPSVLMGIHHQGVRFLHTRADKHLQLDYKWNQISRLTFKKKRFEIFPSDVDRCHRLIYYTGSSERSEYLLTFMKDAHSINMSLTPYMEHIRSQIEKETARPTFRISYIYGVDPEGPEREVRIKNLETSGVSVVESTSEDRKISRASSHTSGIESDSKVKMGDLEAEEEEQQGVTGSIDNHHEEEEVVVAPMKHTVAPPAPGSLLRSESTEDIINPTPPLSVHSSNIMYAANSSHDDDNNVVGSGGHHEQRSNAATTRSMSSVGDVFIAADRAEDHEETAEITDVDTGCCVSPEESQGSSSPPLESPAFFLQSNSLNIKTAGIKYQRPLIVGGGDVTATDGANVVQQSEAAVVTSASQRIAIVQPTHAVCFTNNSNNSCEATAEGTPDKDHYAAATADDDNDSVSAVGTPTSRQHILNSCSSSIGEPSYSFKVALRAVKSIDDLRQTGANGSDSAMVITSRRNHRDTSSGSSSSRENSFDSISAASTTSGCLLLDEQKERVRSSSACCNRRLSDERRKQRRRSRVCRSMVLLEGMEEIMV